MNVEGNPMRAVDAPAWWLLAPLRTSQWHAHITRAGGDLVPDFALIDLRPAHWRQSILRRLLAGGLLWMLAALAVTLVAVALRPGDSAAQLWPYLVPLLAFFASAGLLADYRLGPIFGLLYAGMTLIQSLVLWGPLASMTHLPANGVAAFVAASTAVSLLSFEPEPGVRRRPLRRRLGVLGQAVALGSLAAAGFIGPIVLFQSLVNTATLPALSLALGLGAALSAGLAAWWRVGNVPRALACGAGLGLYFGLLAYGAASGAAEPGHAYRLLDYVRGPLALGAAGAFFSSSFSLTYVLARRNAGPLGAVLAGVMAAGLSWLAIDMLTHSIPLVQFFRFFPLIAFVGVLVVLTLTIGQWRPDQVAQVRLLANQLERIDDIDALARAHAQILVGDLTPAAGTRLRNFKLISQEAAMALAHTSTYSMRLALGGVLVRLDDLVADLETSPERYAGRFHPIAQRWREIVARRLDELARALEQDIANPYVVGVPLTARDEIFVGRAQIAARLEQSLRAPHGPPVLLYGQRRMGKSSLLLNLARLLPAHIVPLYVDGQAIAGAAHYAEFLYHLAGQMIKSARGQRQLALPALGLERLAPAPFAAFGDWLDEVEAVLERHEAVAVLALDEFEALVRVLGRRIAAEGFTDLLRHMIQHRPRFKLVLAGSHTLEEFYPLAGALINLEVMKIAYLTPGEAQRLIEHPVKDFALSYAPDAVRAVIDLTRGHPYLLQLLCYELVWLKNDQPAERRTLAVPADVAEAAGRALANGATFFAALQTECGDAGALPLLHAVAAAGPAGCPRAALPAGADRALEFLLQRDVVEETGEGYKFQVELVRQWFGNSKLQID